MSGELVPKEVARGVDSWKTSFKGHKLPSLKPAANKANSNLLPSRPHEFHTQTSTAEPLPSLPGAALRPPVSPSGSRRTHVRSRSDATGLQPPQHQVVPGLHGRPGTGHGGNRHRQLGDLTSGRAFDNGCECFSSRQVRTVSVIVLHFWPPK